MLLLDTVLFPAAVLGEPAGAATEHAKANAVANGSANHERSRTIDLQHTACRVRLASSPCIAFLPPIRPGPLDQSAPAHYLVSAHSLKQDSLMARPISIRDEDILAAARQVFLERGIRGTSAEVAERAGVSEGSIFKRFPSKDKLFQAAMRVDMDATITFTRQMAERAGESDVRAGLLELGANILQMFRLLLPMMMMRWSNPDEHVEELRQDESPPLQLLAALMDYFGAAVAARRIRAIDVEILSRAFLGALQNYAFFEVLMRVRKENPTPAVTFLRRLVDGLWVGFSPNGERPLKPEGTARGLHKKAPGKHKKAPGKLRGTSALSTR